MMLRGYVNCPICQIRSQAWFQANCKSVLCPNCQEEIETSLVQVQVPIRKKKRVSFFEGIRNVFAHHCEERSCL